MPVSVGNIYYRWRAPQRRHSPAAYRTLLLGTSRTGCSGMPIEQDQSLCGFSAAVCRRFKWEVHLALKISCLKRIIWAVDFFTFDQRLGCNPDTCARLGNLRLLILDNLLSSEAMDAGFNLLKRAILGRKSLDHKALVSLIPWSQDFICKRFHTQAGIGLVNVGENGALHQILSEAPVYEGSICCDEGLALFRSAVAEIKRAGVQLMLFLPPMTQFELEEIRQSGLVAAFQQFKRDLTVSSPYLDFTGYNSLACPNRQHVPRRGARSRE